MGKKKDSARLDCSKRYWMAKVCRTGTEVHFSFVSGSNTYFMVYSYTKKVSALKNPPLTRGRHLTYLRVCVCVRMSRDFLCGSFCLFERPWPLSKILALLPLQLQTTRKPQKYPSDLKTELETANDRLILHIRFPLF